MGRRWRRTVSMTPAVLAQSAPRRVGGAALTSSAARFQSIQAVEVTKAAAARKTQASMPSQRPAGHGAVGASDGRPGPPPRPAPRTRDPQPDHEGQHGAQREADDVVRDGVHDRPEGLPAGPSQDPTVETLRGGRGGRGW